MFYFKILWYGMLSGFFFFLLAIGVNVLIFEMLMWWIVVAESENPSFLKFYFNDTGMEASM